MPGFPRRREELEGLARALLALPPAASRKAAEARRHRLQRIRAALRRIAPESRFASARFAVRPADEGGWRVIILSSEETSTDLLDALAKRGLLE